MYWYFAHNSSSLWIPCPCLPLPPPLWRPLVCFLYLWVCVCSHRRFFGLFLRFTWMMSWSVCLCLTHFTKHSILWTHSCYCKWESPFFFWLSITSLCGYTPHFLYPFICWRAFGLLPCVGYCKWCCSNIGVHVWFFFFQISVFIFFKYIPRSGIAISYDNSIFSFLRNLYTVCYCEKTNLHFHQQYRRVPFSPHPGQQFVICTLYIMAILTGGRWQLTVVLIRSYWLKHCPDLTTQKGRCPALELLGLSPHSWGLGRILRTIHNIPGGVKVVLDSLHFINVFIVQWTYLC